MENSEKKQDMKDLLIETQLISWYDDMWQQTEKRHSGRFTSLNFSFGRN